MGRGCYIDHTQKRCGAHKTHPILSILAIESREVAPERRNASQRTALDSKKPTQIHRSGRLTDRWNNHLRQREDVAEKHRTETNDARHDLRLLRFNDEPEMSFVETCRVHHIVYSLIRRDIYKDKAHRPSDRDAHNQEKRDTKRAKGLSKR